MNVAQLCKGQTFIAKGEALPANFVHGDTIGEARQAASVLDGLAQGVLQPHGSTRAKLYAIQVEMGNMPQVDCPLQHTFAPDVYIRTIMLPKGSVILGKIHKHAHGNILSSGTVTVLTESGGVERLTGPLTMLSEAGTKRAVYAEADAVWTTIHPNPSNTRDLAQLESEIIAATYAEYDAFIAQQDYLNVLWQANMSHADVLRLTNAPTFVDAMPDGYDHIFIAASQIEGRGVFTRKPITAGEFIGPARLEGIRTPLGRYANHSPANNAEFRERDGDLYSVAVADIPAGGEILNNYRQGATIHGITLREVQS